MTFSVVHFASVEPGNGTRYELATARLAPVRGGWEGMGPDGGIFVAWRGHGAALLDTDGLLASSYVREKLGGSRCDASAITIWICGLYPDRIPHTDCDCGRHSR